MHLILFIDFCLFLYRNLFDYKRKIYNERGRRYVERAYSKIRKKSNENNWNWGGHGNIINILDKENITITRERVKNKKKGWGHE